MNIYQQLLAKLQSSRNSNPITEEPVQTLFERYEDLVTERFKRIVTDKYATNNDSSMSD